MNKSNEIKNLAVALKKAQSEMGEVKFDSDNPFFKSRYASLGAVIDASKEALTKNGFSVSQPLTTNEYGVGVTTILIHESGEYIESTMTLPVADVKNIAQEAGKIVTYLRRYSLASILNLYSDEDTDGEQPKKTTQKSTWKPEQVKALMDQYEKLDNAKHAVAVLNLSEKLTPETDVKTTLAWVKTYRDAKDNGKMTTEQAASTADKEIFG